MRVVGIFISLDMYNFLVLGTFLVLFTILGCFLVDCSYLDVL